MARRRPSRRSSRGRPGPLHSLFLFGAWNDAVRGGPWSGSSKKRSRPRRKKSSWF